MVFEVAVLNKSDYYPSELVFSEYTGSLLIVLWENDEVTQDNARLPSKIQYAKDSSLSTIMWARDGYLHRDDNLPSMIRYYNNRNVKQERYALNHDYHCVLGPAIIDYDENNNIKQESYYLNGIELDKINWLNNPLVVRALKNNTNGNIASDVSF